MTRKVNENVVADNNLDKKKNTTKKRKDSKKNKQEEIEIIDAVDESESVDKKKSTKKANLSKKKNTKKKKHKLKKRVKVYFIILLLIIVSAIGVFVKNKLDTIENERIKAEVQRIKLIQKKIKERQDAYSMYVKTNIDSDIYKYVNGKYVKSGSLAKDIELELDSLDIEKIKENTDYFKIKTFSDFYIKYTDIDAIDTLSIKDDRYKKYIPFNKKITTKDNYELFSSDGNLKYSFNQVDSYKIIINSDDFYGIELDNQILYIKNKDIDKIEDDGEIVGDTKGIAVLNYHFFYDETLASERKNCNQTICLSKAMFKSHLEYFKKSNILTLKMKEFEMWHDGLINLPKSVLITIDDGWRREMGVELLEEYKMYGTVFFVTSQLGNINGSVSWLNDSPYVEYHSHGDNIHVQGDCPTGQGGAIQCKSREYLLADLAKSRSKLGNTTYFCYPFYEFNNYSISILKEAGFTMAFADGFVKATKNSDKYIIPRYIVYNTTTANQIKYFVE